MQEVFEKIIAKLEDKRKIECVFTRDKYSEGVLRGISYGIESVNQVASEYGGGWIPCSERLPEDGTTILVQDFEEYYEVCNCETRNGVKGFSSGDWWSSANNYIAWQPLPHPYQPKGE